MSAAPTSSAVWISGTGAVSCHGRGVEALWQAALENRSGIHEGLGRVEDESLSSLPAELRANRILAFSILAAREAMTQAGWHSLRPGDGMILATTTGQILEWDRPLTEFNAGRLEQKKFREHFTHQPLGELVSGLGRMIGHDGPAVMLTSACSASTQALALGAMWIRQGKVKRCLVGGAEVLCDLTTEGFRSLQLLSLNPSTPFDQNRAGINLSEGAAFICLEAQTETPLARLSGFGYSTDGYHMTGPHPEGDGSFRAMRGALEKAGLDANEISWVHAHGTGSQLNDLSEGLAIVRLFGESMPWVSSTKWIHGHSLAASGALETALLVRALNEGHILHTRGLKTPDPKIPVKHPEKDLLIPLSHILKNTLGFGGANAALVLSHPGAAL